MQPPVRSSRLRPCGRAAMRIRAISVLLLAWSMMWGPGAPPATAQGPAPGAAEATPGRLDPGRLDPDRLRELRHLLDDLRDEKIELDRRRRAAAILLHRGWPDAIHTLRQMLTVGDEPTTQRAIAQAVAEIESPPDALIDPLFDLLASDDAALRDDVAAALGRFDEPMLVERLIALSGDAEATGSQRLGAIRALGEHRSQEVVESLLSISAAERPAERDAAFESLARLTGIQEFGNDPAAWQRWWRTARSLPPRRWLATLMNNLSTRNTELNERLGHLKDRLVAAHNRIYDATEEAGRPAILQQMLDDAMPELRLLALRLIERRVLNAQPVSEEVRATMRRRLTDPIPQVRARSAALLENLADARAAELAADLLPGEPEPAVQARLLALLARAPRPEAVEPALERMELPNLRGPAAALLTAAAEGELLSEDQVERARRSARDYLSDPPERPEASVLRLLGRLGEPEDLTLLASNLRHADAAIRRAAAETLASDRWPLEPLLQTLDDPTLRPIALRAAAGRAADAPTLLTLLEHEPSDPETGEPWLEAVLAVAGRLDSQQVAAVDAALAELPERGELRERVLLAASGRPANPGAPGTEPGQASSGNGEASGGRTEAAFRLADYYIATGQTAKAEAVYQQMESRNNLSEENRLRLAVARLGLMLQGAELQIDPAADYTRQALSGSRPLSADALAAPWLEAIERAVEHERLAAARRATTTAADLFRDKLGDAVRLRLADLQRLLGPASEEAPDERAAVPSQ